MAGIRVDNGTREIEVNDDKERVKVPIGDATFLENYANLIKHFEKKKAELEQKEAEYKKKKEDEISIDDIISVTKENTDLCRETCAKLDEFFGEGCCRKVFGENAVPRMEVIFSFLFQMQNEIVRLKIEWDAQLKKEYSNNRKGARSK